MTFVILTRQFYPHKDAEAYCSTRFASALADAGHQVHVVTLDYLDCGESYKALLSGKVRITNVKVDYAEVPYRYPYINLKYLMVWDPQVQEVPAAIRALREVLKQYDHPVLITRSVPLSAVVIGWHCRDLIGTWVAHFSDPMLDHDPNTKLGRLSHFFKKFWMRRAMRHADAISVTCKRVKWYYREQLGPCVDKAKFILATHIGDFKLEGKKELGVRGQELGGRPVIFHDGDIYASRGLQILDAVKNLNEQGVAVDFIQGRAVNNEGDRKRILSTPHCFILNKDSPDELRAQAKAAQVSFVADFNTDGLSYSPFLMSKFVYQLFTDKPIVVLSKLESEKHDYCVAYPEAGLFFADLKEPGSLEKAIRAALTADPKTFDRTRIRGRFSEERIAAEFIEQLECEDRALLEEKWMGRV